MTFNLSLGVQVDFSTMTQEQIDTAMATDPAMEVIRTAEAATSITKDTGYLLF